ncbi:hypothetical protein KDA_73880 [Dictyobacter alpinus]|uniref:Uncharacterized protein n=1 Tax=Dictyobacter alpinus TaxID=2014873 RepID=A0A402BKM7_9CHLR|nr:hypothetical protein KDA_73880 [Dictyobacter alpinus]
MNYPLWDSLNMALLVKIWYAHSTDLGECFKMSEISNNKGAYCPKSDDSTLFLCEAHNWWAS